jgi:hypothetical protein
LLRTEVEPHHMAAPQRLKHRLVTSGIVDRGTLGAEYASDLRHGEPAAGRPHRVAASIRRAVGLVGSCPGK